MPTFPAPEGATATIELVAGDVIVTATDRLDTTVEVTPVDPDRRVDVIAAEHARVDGRSGRISVRADRARRSWLAGEQGAVLVRLGVPLGTALSVKGAVLNVEAHGSVGDLRVRSAKGDVTAEQIDGGVEVRTATGAVDLGSVAGAVTIKSSQGPVRVGSAGGPVRIQSAQGPIDVEAAATDVVAKTAMGDIGLLGLSSGTAVAETAFGAVDIGIVEGVAAHLDLHTHMGRVDNHLADTGAPSGDSRTVEIKARTASGDITVRRRAVADA